MSKTEVDKYPADRGKTLFGVGVFLLVASHCSVVILSWLLKALWPALAIRPLLSEEGVRWLFGQFTTNILSPALVWLLLGLCALSSLRGSRLVIGLRQMKDWPALSYRQRLALRCVLMEVLVALAVILLLTVPPHAVLLNVSGTLFPSSFSSSIFAVCCLTLIAASLTYAIVSADGERVGCTYRVLVEHTHYYWLIPLYVLFRQLMCMIVYVWGG